MIEQYCAELPTPGDLYMMHKMGCANYTEYLHCKNETNADNSNNDNNKTKVDATNKTEEDSNQKISGEEKAGALLTETAPLADELVAEN